ncbi:MAG: GerAB/ArcD/ProY family transporter [Peptococcaceae bacterium]|nr:GerAB/ArcD/ProY family transporter [Peptococcaceae bacterium]
MIKEGKIGMLEAYALVTIVIITKIFYTFPLTTIKQTGTAAWYTTLISCVGAIVFFALLYLLLQRFPQKDLYQVFEAVLGKKVSRFIILIFSVYFLYYTGINLSEFVTILKIYSMPFTPKEVLVAGFLTVIAAMAYVGLEGIVRVAYVLFYLIITGLVLILILAIPFYDFNSLKPWLGYGLGVSASEGFLKISAYDSVIILAIIANSLQGLKYFKRIGLSCLLTAGAIFSICLACILAAFQYTAGSGYISGMYHLSRIIYYSRFFQRVEAIFLFVWVFASVIAISAVFYIALSSYCRVFSITNHRPLLWPFLFLTFAFTFLPSNIYEIISVHVRLIRGYSVFLIVPVPILVLLVSIIRGKKGGKASGT